MKILTMQNFLQNWNWKFRTSINRKDIFPIKKVPFMDTMLMLPSNISRFSILPEKKQEDKVLEIACKTLGRVNKLCKDHGLTYFAVGKLLIDCVKDEKEPELKNGNAGLANNTRSSV